MNTLVANDVRKLLTASSIYGAGKFLAKTASFFLLPLYTAYLSPTDYGILASVNIVGSALGIICMLSFNGAFARYYYDYERSDPVALKEMLGTQVIFIAGLNALFLGVLFLCRGAISALLLPNRSVALGPYIGLQLATVYFSLIPVFLTTSYQVKQQPVRFVLFSLAGLVVGIAAVVCFVVDRRLGAYGALLGGCVGAGVMFCVSIYLLWGQFRLSFKPAFLLDSLRFGFPITIHLLFSWTLGYAERPILLKYVSLNDLGLYYFALQIALVMYFIVESVNQAWAPLFFDMMKNRADAPTALAKLVHYYYIAIVVIAVIGILFSREVLTTFTNGRYHSSFVYIPFLIAAELATAIYFINVNTLFYYKQTKTIPFMTLYAAGVKVVLALALIPYLHLWGAVISTIVSTLIWSVIVHRAATKLFTIPYDLSALVKLAGLFVAVFVINLTIHVHSMPLAALAKSGVLVAFVVALDIANIFKIRNAPDMIRGLRAGIVTA